MSLPVYATRGQKVWYYSFRVICALIFLFLIAPIVIVIPLSFNTQPYFSFTPDMLSLEREGYSTRWYADILRNGTAWPANEPLPWNTFGSWLWDSTWMSAIRTAQWITPFWDIDESLRPEQAFWADMWQNAQWVRAIKNSFFIGIFATLIATSLGTLAAIGLSRSEMPYRRAIMALLISPMVVPLVIIGAGMFFFFSQDFNPCNWATSLADGGRWVWEGITTSSEIPFQPSGPYDNLCGVFYSLETDAASNALAVHMGGGEGWLAAISDLRAAFADQSSWSVATGAMVQAAETHAGELRDLDARSPLAYTYFGIILAHAVLGTPFVIITVTATLVGFDNSLVRASNSLGAGPVRTFFKVQMPLILPGVVSGALFAFVTSFDEVVVMLQMASAEQRTIPRQMFSGIREQISPTILAVATILVIISILLLTMVEILRRRSEKLRGMSPQ